MKRSWSNAASSALAAVVLDVLLAHVQAALGHAYGGRGEQQWASGRIHAVEPACERVHPSRGRGLTDRCS